MSKDILEIEKLQIAVEGKVVLNNFNLKLGLGKVAALVGSNGSGKSSLANLLMGNQEYKRVGGKVTFLGQDLLDLTTDERARLGLYVAWQNPVSIPGVTVFNFCKSIAKRTGPLVEFKKYLEELLTRVGLPKEYLSRNVNEGFSGGERKRLELLQLLLLGPKLAILDEIDSGIDAGGVKILSEIVSQMSKAGTSFLIISHNNKLIEKLGIKKTWKTTN